MNQLNLNFTHTDCEKQENIDYPGILKLTALPFVNEFRPFWEG